MNPLYRITPTVKYLLIVNAAVYLLQLLLKLLHVAPLIDDWGSLIANNVFDHGQVWRLFSYMFLHSTRDGLHILFNMLGLWMFGTELEQRWGAKKFTIFYLVCGVGAALFSWFYFLSPSMRYLEVIGASGAVFGIITAYAFYYPNREVLLFFIIPIRVWIVVAGYAVISLLLAFQSGKTIAHLMHFGGIAVALGYLKGGGFIDVWWSAQKERLREESIRERAKENMRRERFYTEKVDPVLAKIAAQGMASLTAGERKILKEAGKNSRERLKGEKIVPFDAFRNK